MSLTTGAVSDFEVEAQECYFALARAGGGPSKVKIPLTVLGMLLMEIFCHVSPESKPVVPETHMTEVFEAHELVKQSCREVFFGRRQESRRSVKEKRGVFLSDCIVMIAWV